MSRRAERAPRSLPSTPDPEEATGRRPVLVGVALVAVTAVALYLAGSTQAPTHTAPPLAGKPAAVERTLVCAGGLPGTTVLSGSVTGEGEARAVTVAPAADPANVFTVPADRASGGFAGQTAAAGTWLAYLACPEPRANWWFVGVGGSSSHASQLRVTNPRQGDAVIDVDVFGPDGPVAAPGLHGMFVPSGQTTVLDLTKVAAATGDLSVRISASRGLVSATAPESWSPTLVGKPVREWVAAQPLASRRFTLTGIPDKPTRATLLLTNPTQVESVAKIQFIGAGGTFVPTNTAAEKGTVTVPPGAVLPVDLTAAFDGRPVAVTITSTARLVASLRSQVGTDESYAATASRLAETSVLAVPAGVQGEVRVSARASAGSVSVLAYDERGAQVQLTDRLEVKAGTSVGLALPGNVRSVVLGTSSDDLVAGLLLRSGAGIAGAAFPPAAATAHTPRIVPAW